MSTFLTLAYLFFIGSLFGWVLELVFRRFFSRANPEHRWINPGFCVGPYVPLYGCGLCILYLLAALGDATGWEDSAAGRALLFLGMAVSMTAIEYVAGVLLLKLAKVRLWDYSMLWGNVDGLICPLFSLFWALLGGAYYFFVHPHILDALNWLANNLAFSFVIGYFFGVFTIDVAYSFHLLARLRQFAQEEEVVVKLENLKAHLHTARERARLSQRFFFQLHTVRPLSEHLREALEALEQAHRSDANRRSHS
ncbi:MAG: putative ABC transporter permease [Oscillospiraceae bacterium]|nr:putative ABC transporter permease [Oscillospiraceae bacterium]